MCSQNICEPDALPTELNRDRDTNLTIVSKHFSIFNGINSCHGCNAGNFTTRAQQVVITGCLSFGPRKGGGGVMYKIYGELREVIVLEIGKISEVTLGAKQAVPSPFTHPHPQL